MPIQPLINVKKAAEILDVAEGTVYNLVHSGKLEIVKVGDLVKFKEKDLQAYIDRCTIRKSPLRKKRSRT